MKRAVYSSLGVAFLTISSGLAQGQSFVTPFYETEQLTGPNSGTSWDGFGGSLAVSGDVAVVGTAVQDALGSVQVHRYDGTRWAVEQVVTASDGFVGDFFGTAVSISGDVALIGSGYGTYLLRFDGTSWREEQKLTRSASSVSISGDVALLDWGDVYRFDGTSWQHEQTLGFGYPVALHGDVAVLAAPFIHTDQPGKVSVFRHGPGGWVQEQELRPFDDPPSDNGFGQAIAVTQDHILVGARGDTWDGPPTGAAYVYHYDGTSWNAGQKLVSSDGANEGTIGFANFGSAVAISGDLALIGSLGNRDDVHLLPVNGWPHHGEGAAYLFRFDGTSWHEVQKLTSSAAAVTHLFGTRVGLDGGTALVLGMRGRETDDGPGHVHVFEVDCNRNGSNDDWEIATGVAPDANGNGVPDPCEAIGASCNGTVCNDDVTEPASTGGGELWQGAGTDCASAPCAGIIRNVAATDHANDLGVVSGTFRDTQYGDDIYQVLREAPSGGKPENRTTWLSHKWAFDVAPGTDHVFFLDAHRSATGEDDFVFSFSVDDVLYTEMLRVTKTRDDDVRQRYVFPGDVSGLLFVQVVDTDRTPGNNLEDTLFVDEMIVYSTVTPDAVPPAAPTGLVATAWDGAVSLDWADNGEEDLLGYRVYRASSSGGSYTQLGSTIASSELVDAGLINGATYYYTVTAVDTSGNESAASAEVQATPEASVAHVYVASIVVDTVNIGQGTKRGRATVTILDHTGAPVSGAAVTGTFTGDLLGTDTVLTGAAGTAVLLTADTRKGGVAIRFCVDGVVHPSLPYDPAANAETCDVN